MSDVRVRTEPVPTSPVRTTPLRWARFVPATTAEGPGLRAALWVQGCSLRCPGCFNPHLWAAAGGMVEDAAEAAARWVAQAGTAGAQGLTLLGGEPFEQAEALALVAEAFRAAGLTVMTFSGFELIELRSRARGDDGTARLLAATDLLADGPYRRDLPETRRPWVGSTNQGLHALSPAYADAVASIRSANGAAPPSPGLRAGDPRAGDPVPAQVPGDRIEIRLSRDGRVEVNGWASDEALEELLGGLGRRVDRRSDGASARAHEATSTEGALG